MDKQGMFVLPITSTRLDAGMRGGYLFTGIEVLDEMTQNGTNRMKIRISDLPSGVTEDDVRELLESSGDIEGIELITEGDEDNPVAVVELASETAAEGAVALVNGRTWKNATLRADKLLY